MCRDRPTADEKKTRKSFSVLEIRIKIGRPFFEDMYVIDYCSVENVWETWPTKMDFGQPNAEIGRKMANYYF